MTEIEMRAAQDGPASRGKFIARNLHLHLAKNALCCGVPAMALAAGLPLPWQFTETQEYLMVIGLAGAVALGEAAYVTFVKRSRTSLKHMGSDFVVGAGIGLALMATVHAVGLHSHDHGHHHNHGGHEVHSHAPEERADDATPRAQTPLRPATIPGVFTPPSHEGHEHDHNHEGHDHPQP